MPVAQLAIAAGSAAVKYAPAVYDAAKAALTKATGGKVTDVSQLSTYVGNNPQRMMVVGDALIRSGVSVNDVFPTDIVQINPQLRAMREAASKLAAKLGDQFAAGSDHVIQAQPLEDMAADVIRIRRVNAVLKVYGNEETYFLCHPNGGVPPSDFAYKRAMSRALASS